MRSLIRSIIVLVGWIVITASAVPVLADPLSVDPRQNNPALVKETGSIFKLNLGIASPIGAALNLMNLALSLLGGLCLVLLVYAGFLWIWARGNSEVVQKAKDIIEGTAIGLLIVLAALGITRFVIVQVGNITGAEVYETVYPTPPTEPAP